MIEAGFEGLPDFLEPILRDIAAQGVGVSTEGGETFLTTADGTKIATLSQDEDSGETTVTALPEAIVGGDTSGTDDTTGETTTVRIGGGDPGRPGINQPLIDPTAYLTGLEGAAAGQLTPEALSNAFASAILGPNQTPVFEATLSPNQIVITAYRSPDFAPREQTDPLIPTFQRPTLERRPPDPSLVEIDYGELFEGALGDFTGGEGAIDRLVYFLSGLELPDAPAPAPAMMIRHKHRQGSHKLKHRR